MEFTIERSEVERKQSLIFLMLTFILSWIAMGYVIYLGGMQKAGTFIFLVMWVPGIVALLYRFFAKIGFKDVGFRIGHIRYWGLAILVPLVVAAVSYSISWLTEVSSLVSPSAELLSRNGVASPLWLVIKIYPILFIVGCAAALGEELGWRGFLIPKLYKTGIKNPLIVSSLIWGVWHFPLILWGG